MVLRGAYCLCLDAPVDIVVKVGALGCIAFTQGKYVYIGSALNGLGPRVARHVRTNEGAQNVIRWHIDYLLKEPTVTLAEIYYIESSMKLECKLASGVARHGEPVDGFGCSDCKCRSHLYRVSSFRHLEKMGLKRWATGFPRYP